MRRVGHPPCPENHPLPRKIFDVLPLETFGSRSLDFKMMQIHGI